MRGALGVLVSLVVSGCSSSDACHLVSFGSSVELLAREEITPKSDPVFRSLLSPVATAAYGRGTLQVWDSGPAEKAMCCSRQEAGSPLSWCTPEQLSCDGPEDQNIRIFLLNAPFSDRSREPDDASFCFAAARHNVIIAVWHRLWS